MLKNIILTSSEQGSIVLDCFCGSGTALRASQELGRRWIGIDQSDDAIRVTKERMSNNQRNLFPNIEEFEYFEEQLKNEEDSMTEKEENEFFRGRQKKKGNCLLEGFALKK